jgi:hypothetical protein
MGGVPTISRFFGISIAMFFDDHDRLTSTLDTRRAVPRCGSTPSR